MNEESVCIKLYHPVVCIEIPSIICEPTHASIQNHVGVKYRHYRRLFIAESTPRSIFASVLQCLCVFDSTTIQLLYPIHLPIMVSRVSLHIGMCEGISRKDADGVVRKPPKNNQSNLLELSR